MVEVDVKALLAAGAHFGHKTSRWHPKMGAYIHSTRGGAHIIDLIKTAEQLEIALAQIEEAVSKGKQVLFVGTKQQAKEIVKEAAQRSGMPVVFNRWLGGLLTNTKTMKDRIKHLKKLEERMESGELAQRYSKLEVQRFQEEIDKLNYLFGGIKNMAEKPGVVFVTDVLSDDLAVKEARRLGIPVVAIVDTNADPSDIDFVIPANDDAIKSIQLITNYVVEAIAAGKTKQKQPKPEAKSEKTKAKTEKPEVAAKSDESKTAKAKTDAKNSKSATPKTKTADKKPAATKTTAKKSTAKK